jgi:hypothetical protein
MRTFIIANEQTELCNVISLSGNKRVQFDGKTRFNSKQPPAKRMFRKRGGSKVRHPTTGLDRFYNPEEWKALSFDKKDEIMALRKKRNGSVSSAATDWEERTKAQGILQTAMVSSVQTTQRCIKEDDRSIGFIQQTSHQESFWLELDSNADTCCVGGGVMIIKKTDLQVSVTPFIKPLGSI